MNLKVLIWLFSDNVELLNRAFVTLHSRYGVGDFEIAGVLGEYKLFFNGKEPENIHIPPPHRIFMIASSCRGSIPTLTTFPR